jgi:hypothetical protein
MKIKGTSAKVNLRQTNTGVWFLVLSAATLRGKILRIDKPLSSINNKTLKPLVMFE